MNHNGCKNFGVFSFAMCISASPGPPGNLFHILQKQKGFGSNKQWSTVKYNLPGSFYHYCPPCMGCLLKDGKNLVDEGHLIGIPGCLENHSTAKLVVFVKIIVQRRLFSKLAHFKSYTVCTFRSIFQMQPFTKSVDVYKYPPPIPKT